MTSFVLRSVTPLDSVVIAALHRLAFEGRPEFGEVWGPDAVSQILSMRGTGGFLASHEDAPAGFILLRRAAEEAEILSLAVVGPYRRQGLARRLLSAVLEDLVASEERRLFLEVSEENLAALALYETADFLRAGRREAYYRAFNGRRVAALVLERSLPAPDSRLGRD